MKHSNFSRALSLILALVMVLSMAPANVFASGSATATLVTDVSSLSAGDRVVIVAAEHDFALSTNQKTNNRGAAAVTKSDSAVSLDDTVQILTLEAGTVDGTFAFNTGSGYLYAAGQSKEQNGSKNNNYLKTQTDLDANGSWLITIADGVASVVAQGDNGCNVMQYNSGSSLFAAYSSASQGAVALYKVEEGGSTEPPAPAEPVYALANTLAAGDVVVLRNPGSSTVLTSIASGYKLTAVSASVTDGAITTEIPTAEWTVGISDDGTYTFTQGEMVLGMVQSGTYVNLSTNATDGNTAWAVEDSATANIHYLRNVSMPEGGYGPYYLEYYNGYTAYSSSSPSDNQFGFEFYVKGATPIVPAPTDPTDPTDPVASEPTESEPEGPAAEVATYLAEAPQDGDTVLIYNAANTAVLGSELSGKRVAGVTAAAENEQIALADGMARLLVTVDGEHYIFSLDGKYLTSAETGNGMSYAEELTDCGKWTLEQQADGKFIIKNVGANYNGNYNQAMEYYNGFTTYGVKETDIYKMDFYLVDRPAEGGKLTSAEQFVSGTYVMVVEGGYAMGALDGTWVSVVQPTIDGDQVTDAMGGIWTLTVNGSSVQITDANGASIKPKGGNTNGIASGSYDWAWSFDEATQTFTFAGTGSDTVMLASNASEDPTYGGFHKFRGYKNTTISGKPSQYPCNFTLYAVAEEKVESKLPAEGEQVVIYNLASQGVLAAENDTQSIENAGGYLEGDSFVAMNGAVVFTVSKNESYYRFYNETYGYLCSGGTGNNAFYSQELSEDADWLLLDGKSGGFFLESRTAKYNGVYSQYLEYYSDSYKTYSMYNVTDYDIYEFFFYPLNTDFTMGTVVDGIVNDPQLHFTMDEPVKGQDWVITFTVDSVFGLKDGFNVHVVADPNGDGSDRTELENAYTLSEPDVLGVYTLTIPAEIIDACGAGIVLFISAEDNKGAGFGYEMAHDIIDEPSISGVTPASNSQTGTDLRPVISAAIVNAGEDAAVTMTVGGEAVEAVYAEGVLSWQSEADMAEGRTTVTVTVTRADGKVAEKTWSFTVGVAKYELYFGQLHSHTTFSDGSGTLDSALSYIQNLPESANVDFVAFTDHSNYFDTSSAVNPEGALYDMSLAGENSQNLWNSYKTAIAQFNEKQSDVVAIGGFEMTWSGGPGHINTFATPGIVSRNNSVLNNKTADAGMKAYYALLSQSEGVDSISQLNHPGTTFGNFSDFAYWDPVIDSRVFLVEVGNGEGAVGSGGYFPSYEQYTMALDKGWHLAPTNNQDNHKGKWGNANDARDVVLTDDFTEEGIYEAIRSYRVYATEDKNLQIGYTVNGMLLGSIIEEVPEALNFEVTVFDPDSSDSVSKVEVIVNSGKVAHTWDDPADLADGLLTATLAPDYSYYYLRVIQGDGDIAVTAPVWVGEILKLGISAVECGTSTPVTGEELTISTTLFNSEIAAANVKSMTYTIGSQVLAVDTTPYTIPASGNYTVDFKYTPDVAKVMTITVTAVVELDGVEYTFSMDVKLDIQDASKLVYIGIDASHYNEYVNGNYKDSMGNFSNLAAGYSVRAVTLNTSEDLIAACSNEKYVALILTAPSRRLAAAQSDPKVYTEAELAAIQAFNAKGGAVILAGWSDNYENYDVIQSDSSILHMSAAQNEVLKALGSSLRIGDDATYDDVRSAADGVDKWRLYFSTYGENFLTEGIEYDADHPYDRMYTEVFSHYGGATIYTVDGTLPATVSPVVYAHATTYSVDVDKDGLGGSDIPKYAYAEGDDRLMVMAMEQLEGQGLIIVSGAAFMSNFEVQATIEDSGSEKNYSNYRICENLVSWLNPTVITDIAAVQAEKEEGVKFTIEGIVTSNASGYDKDTAFFDCIYLQDATAGINAFPVAGNYKIGDKVRITGTTSSYQGERQIAVSEIKLISEGNEVAPVEITAAELNDGSKLGSLVTMSGTVESFELANGLVQTILVKDESGNTGRVFIDGYITTAYDVENLAVGAKITVTGLASYDNSFDGPAPRIRVRDRKDVICEKHVHTEETIPAVAATFDSTGLTEGKRCSDCGEILEAQQTVSKLDYNEGIVPVANLKVTAGDFYGSDIPANVLDDNLATMWHTDWYGSSTDGHWIQFELTDWYAVDGLRYKPRTDLNRQGEPQLNGTITEYKILVSDNGVDFEEIKTGSWDANQNWKTVEFEAQTVKYIRLVSVTACTDNNSVFASAAEIRLVGVETEAPPCDHTRTETRNAKDATCTEDGYTGDTVCKDCGEKIAEGEVITATGHTFGQWTETKAPTCTEKGTETHTCACGESESRDIDALGHDYVDGACSRCDDVLTSEFADVLAGKFYFDAVAWAMENKITHGMTETAFGPEDECTRGQVVTFLWRAAGSPEPEGTENPFTDVDEGRFYYKAVLWAVEKGITKGMTETSFAPNATCTRGQVVTFLWRAQNKPEAASAEHPFTDVEEGKFYYDAMLWAVENGITEGMTETTFAPNGTCTRGHVITFLFRAATK